MSAFLKTLVTHVAAVVGAVVATAMWTATSGIDLYGIIDQINKIVAAIATLIATITPIATTFYALYRTKIKVRLEEVAKEPDAVKEAAKVPATPQVQALADALKK